MDEDDREPESSRSASSRKTLTLRSNAARQVAVNFLPSRQLPCSTLRMRRGYSEDNILLEADGAGGAEHQADMIVKEMEQNKHLMMDDLEADELRREALRDLPQGLTIKRSVRAKLSASVSLRSKRRPLSLSKRLKYQISFAWKRTQDRLADLVFTCELWYEAIRRLEGHFGSSVGCFFRFLRWVLALDVLVSAATAGLVLAPQAGYRGAGGGAGVGAMDLLTGKGGLEDSVLFYGHYHNGSISTSGLTYNMPFAYFFTIICLYLVVFAVLCYKTAYSYCRNFIFADGVSPALAHRVFCGWDYSIVTPQAAGLHASSIYNELKEILNEQTKNQVSHSLILKLCQYLANSVVNTLVIGLIIGLEYGLWLLLRLETRLNHWELCVSFVITLVLTFVPLLFNFIVRLEYYSGRTSLYVTLARTWALDIGTLLLLLYYWTHSNYQCWETKLGQESYRLVILDVLVSLVILPAVEFIRGYIYKLHPCTSPPEFSLAFSSLSVIYNQALVWLGWPFCPALPALVAAKMFALFYVKRECAVRACQPARKVWRAAQTQTILYMLVTLSLFAALIGIGTMFLGMSSKECGPFRSYEYVYHVFSEGVLHLSDRPTAKYVVNIVTKPGVIALMAMILGVLVYNMRSRAAAQRCMAAMLRSMLLLQARDKDFLLTAIAKVSNGEWMYSPKPEDEGGPETHTWKYLQEVRKPSNADFHFDASRLSHSYIERPKSYLKEKDNRLSSYQPEVSKSNEDGDTDSSFSWQGSSSYLNKTSDVEEGKKGS